LREEEQWVSVPVTKGPQQVKFGVQGDWMCVNRIVITYNFPEPDGIVQPIGWTNGTHAFLYVLNQSYSRMLSDTFGNKAVNITDIEVEVPGLADGTYSIEIVSTQDGDVVNRQVASTSDGKLKLSIPQLSRDLAIRMLPQTESAQAR